MSANDAEILVTGFEPFEGLSRNPTADVARAVEGDGVRAGVLPVDYGRVGAALDALLEPPPRAVVMMGVDPRGTRIHVEKVALNYRNIERADNSGQPPEGSALVERGPAAYFASLPPENLVARLKRAGVRAALSLSAGSYLCNGAYYLALHRLHRHGTPCVFLHVPATPDLGTSDDPMDEAEIVRAVRVVVNAL